MAVGAAALAATLAVSSQSARADEMAMFRCNLARTGVTTTESVPIQGKFKWQQRVGNPEVEGVYGDLILSSPAVADGLVYFGSQNGMFYALDASTGGKQWKIQAGGCVRSSPAVVQDTVFFGSHDKHVYALDARTGKEKWKFKTGGLVRSSPAVLMKEVYHAVRDGQVYVGSQDGYLYALHASTGNLYWRFKTGGAVFSSPALVGGVVYVGSLDGNLYAVDAKTGTEKWHFKTGYWITSAPAVRDGCVYVSSWDGNLYALDAASGKKKWVFDTGMVLGRHMIASPAVTEDLVLIAPHGNHHAGGSYLFALDIRTGEERWRHPVKATVEASPTVFAEAVILVDAAGNVLALDLSTGNKVWERTTGSRGGVASTPTVSGGKLFFGNHGGVMTAIE